MLGPTGLDLEGLGSLLAVMFVCFSTKDPPKKAAGAWRISRCSRYRRVGTSLERGLRNPIFTPSAENRYIYIYIQMYTEILHNFLKRTRKELAAD